MLTRAVCTATLFFHYSPKNLFMSVLLVVIGKISFHFFLWNMQVLRKNEHVYSSRKFFLNPPPKKKNKLYTLQFTCLKTLKFIFELQNSNIKILRFYFIDWYLWTISADLRVFDNAILSYIEFERKQCHFHREIIQHLYLLYIQRLVNGNCFAFIWYCFMMFIYLELFLLKCSEHMQLISNLCILFM